MLSRVLNRNYSRNRTSVAFQVRDFLQAILPSLTAVSETHKKSTSFICSACKCRRHLTEAKDHCDTPYYRSERVSAIEFYTNTPVSPNKTHFGSGSDIVVNVPHNKTTVPVILYTCRDIDGEIHVAINLFVSAFYVRGNSSSFKERRLVLASSVSNGFTSDSFWEAYANIRQDSTHYSFKKNASNVSELLIPKFADSIYCLFDVFVM